MLRLAALVTLAGPAKHMTDSPPQGRRVLVLISFSHEERGGKMLCHYRQMSCAECKLGQGGPFRSHRGGS